MPSPQKIVPSPRKFTEDPLGDVQEPSKRSRHTSGTSLGASLAGQKKYADAEPQLVSGYEGMKRRQDAMTAPDRPALDEAGQSILKLYRDWGKPEKAAEWKQKVQSTSNRDK